MNSVSKFTALNFGNQTKSDKLQLIFAGDICTSGIYKSESQISDLIKYILLSWFICFLKSLNSRIFGTLIKKRRKQIIFLVEWLTH